MARHRKNVQTGESPKRPNLIVQGVRVFQTVLVLLAVGYAAALLLSRTDGFRSIAGDRLQESIGLPVKIGKSHARWNLDIVLRGVATENNGLKSQPGVQADRVLIDWSPLASLRRFKFVMGGAEIDGGEITFATTVTGQWEPARLAPLSAQLAKWLGMDMKRHVKADPPAEGAADKKAGEKEGGPEKWTSSPLRVRNMNIGWWTDATNELARLDGLTLDVTPMSTPGRRLTHYLIKLDHAETSAGFKMRHVNVELVDASDQQVVLSFQADNER